MLLNKELKPPKRLFLKGSPVKIVFSGGKNFAEEEKEIKILMYSSDIVNNYLEYSGKLKENILQYEENAIIPHGDNTQAIGGDQLILGIGN